MSEGTVNTRDGTVKTDNGTVDVVEAKHEWESPIFTKLPAMEAGASSGSHLDGSTYS